MRFGDTGIFGKNHPSEIGGETGIAEFFELDFPKTVGQDIHAIGGTQVFQ